MLPEEDHFKLLVALNYYPPLSVNIPHLYVSRREYREIRFACQYDDSYDIFNVGVRLSLPGREE